MNFLLTSNKNEPFPTRSYKWISEEIRRHLISHECKIIVTIETWNYEFTVIFRCRKEEERSNDSFSNRDTCIYSSTYTLPYLHLLLEDEEADSTISM